MRVLGVEFDSNHMRYVLINGDASAHHVEQRNRLELGDTRSMSDLRAFQDAVRTLYSSTNPDAIGIKAKPEAGQMRAGAAALKMEGIALATAPCTVTFVSGAKVNGCTAQDDSLPKYMWPAYKVAVVTMAGSHA